MEDDIVKLSKLKRVYHDKLKEHGLTDVDFKSAHWKKKKKTTKLVNK